MRLLTGLTHCRLASVCLVLVFWGHMVWGPTLTACNIPVFRYALERWKSDELRIVVYHDQPLSANQTATIDGWRRRCVGQSGHANASITQVQVQDDVQSAPSDSAEQQLWDKLNVKPPLPCVVIADATVRPGELIPQAHLTLSDAVSHDLLTSPARREVCQRLLAGHSVVWLLITSPNAKDTTLAKGMLTTSFSGLAKSVKLPEGIGLPGSELYSDVPLFQKFSVLEIDRSDPQERLLVDWFSRLRPDAFEAGQPLLVPVFGRGRALEVIPASELSPKLVEDLTIFLSGACSCQVKQRNPGFDLLMETDWETHLFGERGERPHDRSDEEGRQLTPQLVPIPSGRR